MATMVTAMEKNIPSLCSANIAALLLSFAISSCAISVSLAAGEWQFTPSFGLEETYTNNIELTTIDTTSSFVSQAIMSLAADYKSRLASFSFTGENNNLFFSHNSDINDNYLTLNSQGQAYLWASGPEVFATATIDNINRNTAKNSLADLVSGDTVQAEHYTSGLNYSVNNSSFFINSSLTYNISRFEDGIGDNNGIAVVINAHNNNNARTAFWQLAGNYSTKKQDISKNTRKGEQFSVEAKLGVITPVNVNPFIRVYDEDFSGDFTNQSQATTASWGPGIRWLLSQHFIIDLAYNYVADDTVSDNYISTSIQWEPSARTSLTAGYSQRFFGDSFNIDLKHKTRRLTNTISYNERLELFDRNNFEQVDLGIFWCPPETPIENIAQCATQPEQVTSEEFSLINFFYFKPIESNEFSLNKRLSWASKLTLARTSFIFNTAATRREGIESKVLDDSLSSSFTVERKISAKSKLTLLAQYNYHIFDKNNPQGSKQEDRYRTTSVKYTKNLASSLSTHFTLQHVNRSSSVEQYTYNEMRAIINVTKEF